MRSELIKILFNEAKQDPSIILLTGDLGFGVLDEFAKQLPNQYLNCGVAEQSMLSMAAGLASAGMKPFVYSIANFPTFRAMEQIRNDIGYMNLGVTIIALGEGFAYGTAGYSHYLIEDISTLRTLRNIRIFSPANNWEISDAVEKSIHHPKPTVLRVGKLDQNSSRLESPIYQFAGFNCWAEGSGGVIIFHGSICGEVYLALDILNQRGYFPQIFSTPEITSIQLEDLVKKNPDIPILVIEEHVLGGLGSILLETVNSKGLGTRIARKYISEINSTATGSQAYMRKINQLDSQDIASAYIELVNRIS
jgi:transketolase